MTRALGRLPHNAAAVSQAPTLRYAAEAPPPTTLDRSAIDLRPILADNNNLPTCAVAALLNAALAVNALAKAGGLAIKDGCWLDFYAACAGCAPTPAAIAATDGLVLLDVLRAQGRAGFDIGAIAPLTGDFGTVPLVRTDIARCMARLGFVYAGVNLAQSDMTSLPDGVWGRATPDPTLGHALLLWDYTGLGDTDRVGLVSWGEFQECTWLGVEDRLREAYGLLLPGIEGPDVDWQALKADNSQWLSA